MTSIFEMFFEIRSESFYDFTIIFCCIILVLISIQLFIGLYKLQSNWKWLIVIPLFSFALFAFLLSSFFDKMPNEIRVKEDTEILFLYKNQPRKKIIRQMYWTGFTGDRYHSDTIRVYELNSSLRIIRKANLDELDSNWIRNFNKE